MKTSFVSMVILSAVLVLGGCSGTYKTVSKSQLVAESDPTVLRLADAADRAASALELLAAVEQTRTPSASVAALDDVPEQLRRSISVSWVGPVEPIAEKLADRAGYEFNTLGDRPPVPVIVTVDAVNKPLIDILRDIGLQVGSRADVIVDAKRQVVEVSYAPISDG